MAKTPELIRADIYYAVLIALRANSLALAVSHPVILPAHFA